MINVPALSEKIFSNSRNRKTYDETVRETMHSEIRSRLLHAKGLVIINCAILIEAGLMPFVNNNVIVVHADQECRIQRMKNRGYSNYKINKRIDAQLAAKEKIAEANRIINRHGTGKVFTYNNHDSVKKRDDYTVLVRSVKRFLKGVENI
jgi:dephospho-CoA kinase